MSYCKQCGAKLAPEAEVCDLCGTKTRTDLPQKPTKPATGANRSWIVYTLLAVVCLQAVLVIFLLLGRGEKDGHQLPPETTRPEVADTIHPETDPTTVASEPTAPTTVATEPSVSPIPDKQPSPSVPEQSDPVPEETKQATQYPAFEEAVETTIEELKRNPAEYSGKKVKFCAYVSAVDDQVDAVRTLAMTENDCLYGDHSDCYNEYCHFENRLCLYAISSYSHGFRVGDYVEVVGLFEYFPVGEEHPIRKYYATGENRLVQYNYGQFYLWHIAKVS